MSFSTKRHPGVRRRTGWLGLVAAASLAIPMVAQAAPQHVSAAPSAPQVGAPAAGTTAQSVLRAATTAGAKGLPTTGAVSAKSRGRVAVTTPNVPQVTGPIPRTATSIPIGTAYLPAALGSVNLADHGYVEEEYFVSGTANVYEYDASGKHVVVKTPDVPYTTVILVRRPADPRRFSGRVQLEMSHPQFGVTTQIWAHNSKKFMADGDAWVRVTNSRGGMAGSSLGVAKQYDPTRYAALNFPEDGLNWDVIGQIGNMLKSNASVSPLKGYRVKQLFMEGFSGAGAITLIWANEFSPILRLRNGGSIVDGFVVGEPSGYPLINSQSTPIAATDPRQKVIANGVPVVKLHTRPEPATQQRPDSDSPRGQYRTYEVAGAAHTDNYTNPYDFPTFVQEAGTPWAQTNLYPFMCQYKMNDFPFEQQWQLSVGIIERWASQKRAGHRERWSPPHGQRIRLNADGTIAKDAFGNDAGGVRSPAVDVPTATYYDTNLPLPGDRGFCSNTTVGHVEPFSKATLKRLYPTHASYVRKVRRSALQLQRQGWLLPADARSAIRTAERSDIP
jgi:hypothetical protein